MAACRASTAICLAGGFFVFVFKHHLVFAIVGTLLKNTLCSFLINSPHENNIMH